MPDELIGTDFIVSDSVPPALYSRDLKICLTRRSLKHIAEKADGRKLFKLIPLILRDCHAIYSGSKDNRLIIARWMLADTNIKPHIVSAEIMDSNTLIIVTAFVAKQKYLKNFKILWRTAYPPSAYSL